MDDIDQIAFKRRGGNPFGMVRAGNIDLNNRPILRNLDGTISTERSFSRGTDQGEVLVPQIVNGRDLGEDDAWQHYLRSRENMGTFSSPEYADAYAQEVHNRTLPNPNASHRPMYVMETPSYSRKFAHAGGSR